MSGVVTRQQTGNSRPIKRKRDEIEGLGMAEEDKGPKEPFLHAFLDTIIPNNIEGKIIVPSGLKIQKLGISAKMLSASKNKDVRVVVPIQKPKIGRLVDHHITDLFERKLPSEDTRHQDVDSNDKERILICYKVIRMWHGYTCEELKTFHPFALQYMAFMISTGHAPVLTQLHVFNSIVQTKIDHLWRWGTDQYLLVELKCVFSNNLSGLDTIAISRETEQVLSWRDCKSLTRYDKHQYQLTISYLMFLKSDYARQHKITAQNCQPMLVIIYNKVDIATFPGEKFHLEKAKLLLSAAKPSGSFSSSSAALD